MRSNLKLVAATVLVLALATPNSQLATAHAAPKVVWPGVAAAVMPGDPENETISGMTAALTGEVCPQGQACGPGELTVYFTATTTGAPRTEVLATLVFLWPSAWSCVLRETVGANGVAPPELAIQGVPSIQSRGTGTLGGAPYLMLTATKGAIPAATAIGVEARCSALPPD